MHRHSHGLRTLSTGANSAVTGRHWLAGCAAYHPTSLNRARLNRALTTSAPDRLARQTTLYSILAFHQ